MERGDEKWITDPAQTESKNPINRSTNSEFLVESFLIYKILAKPISLRSEPIILLCQTMYWLLSWIHVCVVMTGHAHILLTPLEMPNLGYHSITTILHSIKSYSSLEANRLMNRQGVFWQREYFDRIIRSESDLFEKWNYFRTNPVRNGLVEVVEEYPFLYEGNWRDWRTGWKPMLPWLMLPYWLFIRGMCIATALVP